MNTSDAVLGHLLSEVEGTVARYVVLPGDHESAAVALWVAHTYALEGAHATPYLLVVSPEKRSGKTRLLEVLELLVASPWAVKGGISEAAMFRKIDQGAARRCCSMRSTRCSGRHSSAPSRCARS